MIRTALYVFLIIGIFVSCAHKVKIITNPDGAKVRINGETVGDTPAIAAIHCSTFERPVMEISKEGYRTLTTKLEFKADPVAIVLDAFIFWPALFFNAACPKDEYHFDLDSLGASAGGLSTLTVLSASLDYFIYIDDKLLPYSETIILMPGVHQVSVFRYNQVRTLGSIDLRPNTDYVVSAVESAWGQ